MLAQVCAATVSLRLVLVATQHFDISSVSVQRDGFAQMVSSASGIVS
jgi:hypothetical protein